jgi:hypothetical protein
MDLKCLAICIFILNTRKKLTVKRHVFSFSHESETLLRNRFNSFFYLVMFREDTLCIQYFLNIHKMCCFLKKRDFMPTQSNWQNDCFIVSCSLPFWKADKMISLNSIIVSIFRDYSSFDFSVNNIFV